MQRQRRKTCREENTSKKGTETASRGKTPRKEHAKRKTPARKPRTARKGKHPQRRKGKHLEEKDQRQRQRPRKERTKNHLPCGGWMAWGEYSSPGIGPVHFPSSPTGRGRALYHKP